MKSQDNSTFAVLKFFDKNNLKIVLISGLVAGVLDIMAAIVLHTQLIGRTTTIQVLQYIASAVYGPSAFAGGLAMAVLGLLFHFIIAFGFALIYYLAVPYFRFLQLHKLLSGLAYGAIIWALMSFVVVPLTPAPPVLFKFDVALFVLMCHLLFIGLPISWLIGNYYEVKKMNKVA